MELIGDSKGKVQSIKNGQVRHDLEQRKVLVSASLVSVLAAVIIANQTLLKKQDTHSSSRSLASAERFERVDADQLAWQKKLAHELADSKGQRELASLGRPPNAFDQLRFGFFEGKYSFQLEHGKIKEVNFVDSGVSGDRPKYINDVNSFLVENKSSFYIDYSKVEKGLEEHIGGFKIENYALYKNTALLGWAQVFMDDSGRTHAIKLRENKE
ncbi:MAG: hypothetical protein AB7F59_10490 [Bdellovibrionales bacterium]